MAIEKDTIAWKCYSCVLCRLNELPQGDLSAIGADVKLQ